MSLAKSLKRRPAKRKDLAVPARAHGRGLEDPSAQRLNVASQVGEGAPEAYMVIDEEVDAAGLNGAAEGRLEGQAVEPPGSRVPDRVRLDERRRHREAEPLAQFVGHRVGDEVDPGRLDGPNRDNRRSLVGQAHPDASHGVVGEEVAGNVGRAKAVSTARSAAEVT